MNAIVPINITALRVSENDNTNIVSNFKGRVANFNNLPYLRTDDRASTGDTVVQPLDSAEKPLNDLGPGIHLHWELPDYFRRGVHQPDRSSITFPQVPNRWLVLRYLSLYDKNTAQWGPPKVKGWVIESDYIAEQLLPDSDGYLRPAVPVPLPVNPASGEQPYRYMGRIVDAENWNPAASPAANYLPAYKGADNQPLYLTAIGFLGPGFSAFYPDCNTVFGFWDRFLDEESVACKIENNQPLQFKASYQVMGWIAAGAPDPMDGLAELVRNQYDTYVKQAQQEKTALKETPATVFARLAQQRLRWQFSPDAIKFTLNASPPTLATLDIPTKTLCAGILQEVVWNNLANPATSYFLNNPDNPQQPWCWTDNIELAVGNTPIEALSALLKKEMGNEDDDPDVLKNYEYLLDALQLGLLKDLEQQQNKIIELEESLHSAGFARRQGGLVWIVQPVEKDIKTARNADAEITLPLDLAEQLHLLNQAQKAYDTGREALERMRRQLFMDWFRYVQMKAGGITDPNVSINTLINFLGNSGGSELADVVEAGQQTGILEFTQDRQSQAITGIKAPSTADSLAYEVWQQYNAFLKAMQPYPDWQVTAVPAAPFWLPAEPVALMEGSRIEPVRRNGATDTLSVRASGALLSVLDVSYQEASFSVATSAIAGQPKINPAWLFADDLQALVGEAYLLIPTLAGAIADALKAEGGANNPATVNISGFIAAMQAAQGGLSPLEGQPDTGLFAQIRTDAYQPTANPSQKVDDPLALTVTFTNADQQGWAPSPVAWNAQRQYSELADKRYDPFLPVSMVWQLHFDPLRRENGNDYTATNLSDYFQLDNDAVEYIYRMQNGAAVDFTTGIVVPYGDAVVLSKRPTFSLTRQIDSYRANFPDDPADQTLKTIAQYYQGRHIIAQGMSGFNVEQLLTYYIAQIPVEDLTVGARDSLTRMIATAAAAAADDNWYDTQFNAQAPIAKGFNAIHNFGPLRAGFMGIVGLEIIDVFGQRMQLSTKAQNTDGSFQVITALPLQPRADDTANAGKIYLPPRLLTPTRLWFRWLSATHNDKVSGVSDDFVEINTHPATSPVCGWVMPNHLDNSLFFYDAPGSAIGSFGIEHGALTYRTRAGNLANPKNILARDIAPPVNPHLAAFMRYIDGWRDAAGQEVDEAGDPNGQGAAFLQALMRSILQSEQFIDSANHAQDGGTAVLIGRPLALTRCVLGLETAGRLLPLSQADVATTDPWPQDINNLRYRYTDRMAHSSANLGHIQFPARLGDLANIDDGLVGYIIESNGIPPKSHFYAPAAGDDDQHGVVAPAADTLSLALNTEPLTLLMLVDPRAGVHATVGVLPVEEIRIPQDQYVQTLRNLQMTFFTLPVLAERQSLVVPLPKEVGYVWSWVNPGGGAEIPLPANAVNGDATWDYSPQTLLEGWLKLKPDPNQDKTKPAS